MESFRLTHAQRRRSQCNNTVSTSLHHLSAFHTTKRRGGDRWLTLEKDDMTCRQRHLATTRDIFFQCWFGIKPPSLPLCFGVRTMSSGRYGTRTVDGHSILLYWDFFFTSIVWVRAILLQYNSSQPTLEILQARAFINPTDGATYTHRCKAPFSYFNSWIAQRLILCHASLWYETC